MTAHADDSIWADRSGFDLENWSTDPLPKLRDCVRSSFRGDTIQHQVNCGDVQQCF